MFYLLSLRGHLKWSAKVWQSDFSFHMTTLTNIQINFSEKAFPALGGWCKMWQWQKWYVLFNLKSYHNSTFNFLAWKNGGKWKCWKLVSEIWTSYEWIISIWVVFWWIFGGIEKQFWTPQNTFKPLKKTLILSKLFELLKTVLNPIKIVLIPMKKVSEGSE